MSATVPPKSVNEVIEVWMECYRVLLKNKEFLVRDWLKKANLMAPTIEDFVSHYHGIVLSQRDAFFVSELIRAVHSELTAVNST
jgi:hypothetical protein